MESVIIKEDTAPATECYQNGDVKLWLTIPKIFPVVQLAD